MTEDKTTRSRICVVGSANVDLTFRTQRLPTPGETLAGRSLHQGMGGKGANQAVAAARLGAQVAFIARVGSDAYGREAVLAYESEGIDTSFVSRAEEQPTGTAAILVDDAAENCIVVVPGANAELTEVEIKSATSVIRQSAAVLCQLETPIAAAVAAFQQARVIGATTILTPAPAEFVTEELLSLCDVCVPNIAEISEITGHTVENEADALRAAQLLRERGVGRVALTMGSAGVLLLDDSRSTHVAAKPVEATDTTGAGDAFTAGLAVSLADGLDFVDAAHRAVIAAAISVTRPGTQASFSTLEEVNNWITRESSKCRTN
ncbi:MAG: ribokinase [Pirellulaceae bacterium]